MQVRCWDQRGEATAWSETGTFHTGLLPWSADEAKQLHKANSALATPQWIGENNLLRREFTLPLGFTSATIVISGVGYHELFLNGNKVGQNKLDPGWTHYSKRVLYVTHDVTQLLNRTGINAVGVMLGGGWYRQGERGEPALYFELRVNSLSGQQTVLVSDGSWSGSQGPILSDSVYNGEIYDARLEQPGWSSPGFKGNWPNATVVAGPQGKLSAQMIPPIKMMNVLSPISRTIPVSNTPVFDFGQTFSGWCKLRVTGPRGTTITLRYAEVLSHDGTGMPNFENLRSAQATDTYILKGDPNGEVYEPRFTYHGFRFVQVVASNFWYPALSDIEGHQIYSSLPTVGSINFYSDDDGPAPILNRLQKNIWWGQASNLMSVPTDCNQRDERLGWTADAQLSAEEALHNFDMGSFYSHWLNLMEDDQENKQVTNVVPNVRFPGRPADPAWGAAFPLVTYWVWKYNGDLDVVRKHYNGIQDWVSFLDSQASQTGLKGMFGDFGDWVPPPPAAKASIPFTSSWYYLYNVKVLGEMASALYGPNSTDAAAYSTMYEKLVLQFNSVFYNPNDHTYDTPLQTSYIMPLWLGMVPGEKDTQALHMNLLNDIVVKQKTHLSTGILGTKYLLPALSKFGRTDLALQLATQTTYPSWAYMWTQTVEAPATTLWELWNAPTGSPTMDSRNHIMFGSVGDWLYQSLAGIRQPESSTGYRQIVFQPPPSNVLLFSGLRGVNASLEWLAGRVASSWFIADDGSSFTVRVSVPSQSTANVTIPLLDYSAFVITESGRPVWRDNGFVPGVPGVQAARATNEAVVFSVASGNYVFVIANGKTSVMTCGEAGENQMLYLSCPDPGQVISVVSFASFGTPTGGFQCAAYARGSCDAGSSTYVVERECLFQHSCRVLASDATFGEPCHGSVKSLRASVLCSDKRVVTSSSSSTPASSSLLST